MYSSSLAVSYEFLAGCWNQLYKLLRCEMTMTQYVELVKSLNREEIMDEQFAEQLHILHETSPDFVDSLFTLFFEGSEKLLSELTTAFEQQNVVYNQAHDIANMLKENCDSVGAKKLKNVCAQLQTSSKAKNREGCLESLQQVTHEVAELKNNLPTLSSLAQQIRAAGGAVPAVEVTGENQSPPQDPQQHL